MTAGTRVARRLAHDDRLVAFIRRGDTSAFEAVYERHARELLSFCVYMLGSRQDAEDAVQATFASAYSALRADRRPIALRPWLFAIARNDCLSILRKRRTFEELNGEPALGPDPVRELELREELREMIATVRQLPECERAALVLTEVHGLSQREIGTVLGVRTEQVKAYVYQARSKLLSERQARETDCREIREELASARGAALLRGRLRRHVRSCADCRVYAAGVSRQRRQLSVLLPIGPSLALRYRALEEALGIGGGDPANYAGGAAVGASVASAAAEVASGGLKALAVKVAAGVAAVGAGAGVGVSVLSGPVVEAPQRGASTARAPSQRLVASIEPTASLGGANLAQRLRMDEGSLRAGARHGGSVTVALPEGDGGTAQQPPAASLEAGIEPASSGDPAQRQGGETRPSGGRRERQAQPVTPPKTDVQRQAIEAERARTREGRLRATEQQRHEREARGPAGSSRVPKTEEARELKSAERRKAREERPPEGHSRAPKTEEERRQKREERLRRREERRAAEAASP
jgi:RNA polymerase sigma factor (sigma-70 family)